MQPWLQVCTFPGTSLSTGKEVDYPYLLNPAPKSAWLACVKHALTDPEADRAELFVALGSSGIVPCLVLTYGLAGSQYLICSCCVKLKPLQYQQLLSLRNYYVPTIHDILYIYWLILPFQYSRR